MLTRLFGSKPAHYQARLAPAGMVLRVGARETVLQAALNQGIAFPNSCRAGGCGSCKCRLVKGRVKELTDKSYILSAEEMRANTILACQSIARSDIEIEVTLGTASAVAPVQQTTGRISRLAPLTHDIVHLALALEQAVHFTPGQYAVLTATEGAAAGLARSYSFANAPAANGSAAIAEFFIRRVPGGRFTEWLFSVAREGDRLELAGPHGDFMLRESSAPILCIAGGSGLAPVLSLLQGALASLKRQREVTLVFGARTQQDLYMLEAIEALRREWPRRFEFVPVLASEPAGSGWQGRRGLVPEHLGDILGNELPAQQAYLCGPPGMIDACVAELKSVGTADEAIFFDIFLDQAHTTANKRAA